MRAAFVRVVRRARRVVVSCAPCALALSLVLSSAACKRTSADASRVDAGSVLVKDGTEGLLLTWVDEKGDFHVEQKVTDVPAVSRDVVRVVDPNRDPPTPEQVFVADLRSPGPDGVYPVRVVKRSEFEQVAVERRAKHGGALLEAQPPASASGAAPRGSAGAPSAQPLVIIYGASWCGPCHQAKEYLTKRGIPFVEKDIEEDGSAQREMQAKLAKAGMRGGSIPVIDVRGTLLVGFDPRSIERVLGH